jgi:hypothetical protein
MITVGIIIFAMTTVTTLGYIMQDRNKEHEAHKMHTYMALFFAVSTALFLAFCTLKRTLKKNAGAEVARRKWYLGAIATILVMHIILTSGGIWFKDVMPVYIAFLVHALGSVLLLAIIRGVAVYQPSAPGYSLRPKPNYNARNCMPFEFVKPPPKVAST